MKSRRTHLIRNGFLYKSMLIIVLFLMIQMPENVKAIVNESLYERNTQQVISGIVNDPEGRPISGVSVLIMGTKQGTQTDSNGMFSITATLGDNLMFSYIGYKELQVSLVEYKTLNITLESDLNELNEIVIVGFGEQKKVNLTGAVGVLDKKALAERPVQNVAQALQGMVPGLNIDHPTGGQLDSRSNINIRGVGTIGQGSQGGVLTLVDGMEADIKAINPQDIESISVLKDAAASSIYGSRAPFGVILITTKKGSSGRTVINYNNNFRYSSPINLPKMVDSYKFATFFNDASVNAGWGDRFDADRMQRIKDFIDGQINTTTIPNSGNPNIWGDGYDFGNDNVNYYEVFFRNNASTVEHNLSFSGGKDKISYYMSGNYLDQNGLLKNASDNYKRLAATGKINAEMSSKLSLNYNTRFIRESFDKPRNFSDNFLWDLARQAWPTKPLYDPNGNLFDDIVLNMNNGGRTKYEEDWLYQQVQAVFRPVEGLRLVGDVNYRSNTRFTRTDVQTINQIAVDGVSKGLAWNPNTLVNESVRKNNYYNINTYADYEISVADDNHFKFMTGVQVEGNKYRDMGAERLGVMVAELPTLNTTTGLGADGIPVPPSVYGAYTDWTTMGLFGRVNYDYKGKYLIEANLRYDGTSRFRSNSRWGFFPSFSAGWNIAQEDFFKPFSSTIQLLKLRASYGSLGNQNTNNIYPTYALMGVGVNSGQWLLDGQKPTISWPPSLISTILTWENIKSYNIGLDLSMLQGRLSASADLFTRYTENMVGPAPELPAILGTAVPVTNNTDLRTQGFELELSWRDRTASGFGYGTRLVLSDSKTKITRYSNPSNSLSTYRSGQSIGEIWGYTTVGIAHNQQEMDDHLGRLTNGGQSALGNYWSAGDIMYKDINGDGKIDWGAATSDDPGDLRIIGNSSPRYAFGLELSADWKGFDVRTFFQGVLKRDVFQGSYYFWGINGEQGPWFSAAFSEHMNYFRPDADHPLGQNLDSYYPRALFGTTKNQETQTRYLQDASYIRLKNLQLGYTLTTPFMRKSGIQSLRLFASGENLFTLTGLSSIFDPETVVASTGGNVYPLSKIYSFGINVNF